MKYAARIRKESLATIDKAVKLLAWLQEDYHADDVHLWKNEAQEVILELNTMRQLVFAA